MSGQLGSGRGDHFAREPAERRETPEIGDGLATMGKVINPREIAGLLGALTRWVDPATFRLLPVWFPFSARKFPSYNAKWTKQLTNNKKPKFEGNTNANMTLARALGVTTKDRPNWTCCHIWGNDDTSYATGHSEVNDPRYYSCLANMVLLPTPLKAFTDSVPEVKAALRLAAYKLYGFMPEGRETPTDKQAGAWLPHGWGGGEISGIVPMSSHIHRSAKERFSYIKRRFNEAPGYYPREQVKTVSDYWAKKQPKSLFTELQTEDKSYD